MFLGQKTKRKVIISWNQFSDLFANFRLPWKRISLLFESEEGFEVSLVVNYQAKFIFIGRIDIFENYENMKSFHQTFRECFVLFVKLVVQL